MESNILTESVTLGNFIDDTTFLDDEGNPIPLIKSDLFADSAEDPDAEIDDEDSLSNGGTGSSENADGKEGNNPSSSNNDSGKDSDNNSNSNSNSKENSDADSNDNSSNSSGNSSKNGSDSNSNNNSSNSSSNSSSSNSSNSKDQKPDPNVFKNPPKIIRQGNPNQNGDGLQYDLDSQPLVYRDGNSNNQPSGQQGKDNQQKKKIAPNPNKIYIDSKTGKQYKFDYSKGKFIEVRIGAGR